MAWSRFHRPPAGKASDYAIKNTGDSLIDLLTKYVAIQIQTDEGVTGESFSLGGGVGMAHYLAGTVKPFLIGKNPLHREAIWQGMWHFNRFWLTPVTTLGVIDVALWDLYGKLTHQPVSEILGVSPGTVRSRLFYAHRQLQNHLEEFRR